MSEFNNRIAAQRDILLIVNCGKWKEELYGLSSGAINRWININNLETDSVLIELVQKAAQKLFFLSNKSQEQITEEYKSLSRNVSILTRKIEVEVIKNPAAIALKYKNKI